MEKQQQAPCHANSVFRNARTGITRRFAPKVKTGCYSCRRRRIKCPEQKPTCSRCEGAQLDCQYPVSAAVRQQGNGLTFRAIQPSAAAALSPDGVLHPSQGDVELFTLFCSSTVRMVSGPFNRSFWQVDVPRAAVAYPAMWHAAVAMAAIHLSVASEAGNAQDPSSSNSYLKSSPYVARNHYYIVALEHFNKSIRLLSQALPTQKAAGRCYANQEMAIMTNILYIGTASVLDDEKQISLHTQNLLRLLEILRFGDNDNSNPASLKGIMAHDALLSLVLAIDGTFTKTPDMPGRAYRKWRVTVPSYDSFASVTEAYLSILPLLSSALMDPEVAVVRASIGPARFVRRRAVLRRFETSLDAFRASSGASWSDEERESMDVMTKHLEVVQIHEAQAATTRLEDVLRIEQRYIPALSRLAATLSKASAVLAPYQPGQPYLSSLSFGSLLEFVATRVRNVAVQRQVIAMMRSWPYRESGARSHESVVYYETAVEHEQTGPARTRDLLVKLKLKQAARAMVADPHSDALLERVSQCQEACHCISGLIVCRSHKVGDYCFVLASEHPYLELQNRFERENHFPYTKYYL